jgi:very-short-patch-repair endonuclease
MLGAMSRRKPLPRPLDSAPFSYSQGLAAGLTPGELRSRHLARPFHGVRHPGGGDLRLEERCAAFQLTMPTAAFFNSVTAALLLYLPLPHKFQRHDPIHVAIPTPARASAAKGVIGHKVQLMGDDWRVANGLRVASPERTFCELSAHLSIPQLVAVGDHLVSIEYPSTTVERLVDAACRYPARRKTAVLTEAIPLLDGRSESPRESELRVILSLAGITGFVPNLHVRASGRDHRVDLAFPAEMVAIEYQGEYHFDLEQQRRDMTRRARLEAAGWYVMEVNLDDLRDPVELVARIRMVLARRAGGAR